MDALVQLALHDHVVIDDGHHFIHGLYRGVAAYQEQRAQHSGRRQSESLVFTFTITLNAFVEEALYLGASQAAESFQDDLQEDAVVAFFVLRSFWLNSS
jgi:hypothetical protein